MIIEINLDSRDVIFSFFIPRVRPRLCVSSSVLSLSTRYCRSPRRSFSRVCTTRMHTHVLATPPIAHRAHTLSLTLLSFSTSSSSGSPSLHLFLPLSSSCQFFFILASPRLARVVLSSPPFFRVLPTCQSNRANSLECVRCRSEQTFDPIEEHNQCEVRLSIDWSILIV